MGHMIAKVSMTGFMVLGMGLGALLQGASKSGDVTHRLTTHELVVVDAAGQVRWMISAQDKASGTARIQGLDKMGKERIEIDLGLDGNPTLMMLDPTNNRPAIILEIGSGDVPSLKMLGRTGNGICNDLTIEAVEKDLCKGVLRSLQSDGMPVK